MENSGIRKKTKIRYKEYKVSKKIPFKYVLCISYLLTKYGGVLIDKSKNFYYIKIYDAKINNKKINEIISNQINRNKILKNYSFTEPIKLIALRK